MCLKEDCLCVQWGIRQDLCNLITGSKEHISMLPEKACEYCTLEYPWNVYHFSQSYDLSPYSVNKNNSWNLLMLGLGIVTT